MTTFAEAAKAAAVAARHERERQQRAAKIANRDASYGVIRARAIDLGLTYPSAAEDLRPVGGELGELGSPHAHYEWEVPLDRDDDVRVIVKGRPARLTTHIVGPTAVLAHMGYARNDGRRYVEFNTLVEAGDILGKIEARR